MDDTDRSVVGSNPVGFQEGIAHFANPKRDLTSRTDHQGRKLALPQAGYTVAELVLRLNTKKHLRNPGASIYGIQGATPTSWIPNPALTDSPGMTALVHADRLRIITNQEER